MWDINVLTRKSKRMDFSMIKDKIEEYEQNLSMYKALYMDYVVKNIPVLGIQTDAVYGDFCSRHPDVKISQRKFTRLLCEEFRLTSVQGWLNGKRGSFYECL